MEYVIYNGEKAKKHYLDGYYATESGIALSVKVKGGKGKKDYNNPRPLGIKYDKDGYQELCLSYVDEAGKQKRKSIKVHQFVWEVYRGERPTDLTIDHIDRNKLNNSLDNLRLLSREENTSIASKGNTPWQKGKKHTARVFFHTFVDNVYIGTFDRQELMELFHLKRRDVEYKETRRTKRMRLKLIKRVEDIEKADHDECFS